MNKKINMSMDPIYLLDIESYFNYPKRLLNKNQNENREIVLKFKNLIPNKIDEITDYFEKTNDDNLLYIFGKIILSSKYYDLMKIAIKYIKKIDKKNIFRNTLLYDLYDKLSKNYFIPMNKYKKIKYFYEKKIYRFENHSYHNKKYKQYFLLKHFNIFFGIDRSHLKYNRIIFYLSINNLFHKEYEYFIKILLYILYYRGSIEKTNIFIYNK